MDQHIKFENATDNPMYPGVKDIAAEDLLKYKDQIHIVDVRQKHEFIGELGHIAGAQLITLDTLPQNIEQLPKNKTIVFICRSGNRSGHAALFCQEYGLEHVYNMSGGMIYWNEIGLATEG